MGDKVMTCEEAEREYRSTLLYKLVDIQSRLKVPKNQVNKFGGFNFRSAEDIIEKAKPLCVEHGLLLITTDTATEVGGWHYIECVASITNGVDTFISCGVAREQEEKKGADASQISGMASSYAKKRALCGLFGIDDGEDADAAPTGLDARAPKKPTPPAKKKDGKRKSAKSAAWALMVKVCGGDKNKATKEFNEFKSREDFEDCDGFWKARCVELQALVDG